MDLLTTQINIFLSRALIIEGIYLLPIHTSMVFQTQIIFTLILLPKQNETSIFISMWTIWAWPRYFQLWRSTIKYLFGSLMQQLDAALYKHSRQLNQASPVQSLQREILIPRSNATSRQRRRSIDTVPKSPNAGAKSVVSSGLDRN